MSTPLDGSASEKTLLCNKSRLAAASEMRAGKLSLAINSLQTGSSLIVAAAEVPAASSSASANCHRSVFATVWTSLQPACSLCDSKFRTPGQRQLGIVHSPGKDDHADSVTTAITSIACNSVVIHVDSVTDLLTFERTCNDIRLLCS